MEYLLYIGIILISTKIGGLLSRKLKQPQVLGSLLVGLLLGPAVLGVLHNTDMIEKLSELGVIVLMYMAGLGTDLKELKKATFASTMIAILGMIVPFLFGYGTSAAFKLGGVSTNVYVGAVLTATSVSITVETLNEMGKLKTRSGTAILGAAILDDILGIVLLSIVSGKNTDERAILLLLSKMALFFIAIYLFARFFIPIFDAYFMKVGKTHRIPTFAFSMALMISYAAELLGMSAIIGAYFTGLIFANTLTGEYIEEKVNVLSYLFLTPIFFASVGMKATLNVPGETLLFLLVLTLVAITGKIIGCGLGAKISRFTNMEALRVGIGMVSRGEVALIMADIGLRIGVIDKPVFSVIIVMVLITTMITPVLLKMVYSSEILE